MIKFLSSHIAMTPELIRAEERTARHSMVTSSRRLATLASANEEQRRRHRMLSDVKKILVKRLREGITVCC